MEHLLQDLKFAFRRMVKRPGFTAIAIASLGIGVAANTTILSTVDTVFARAVPGLSDGDRVVELGRTDEGRGWDTFSYPEAVDLGGLSSFDESAAWTLASFSFNTGGESDRVTGFLTTGGYFGTLGVRPSMGSFYGSEVDAGVGAHPVVVVSHAFWTQRLGSDPDAVGRTIDLNRVRFTVVGVGPEEFRGHMLGLASDVFIPFTMGPATNLFSQADFDCRNCSSLFALARLSDGATMESAGVEAELLFDRLRSEFGGRQYESRFVAVAALGPIPAGGRAGVAGFLGALFAFAAIILLITCSNVAGMLIAQAVSRRKETAVRLAVGAGRARLVRSSMVESALLFGLGGVVGVLGAYVVTTFLSTGGALNGLPIPVDLALDLRPRPWVLVSGVGIALFTGLLFGLAPALQGTRFGWVESLRNATGGGGGRQRLRRFLVVGQVALSLLLLACAALFLRSLQNAGSIDAGFDSASVYVTTVDLSMEGYPTAESGAPIQARMLERLRAIPGVQSVGLALDLPLDLGSHGTGAYPSDWESPDPERTGISVDFNVVSTGYFEALEMGLDEGRYFDVRDGSAGEPVAIVDRTFADRVWPGQSALGKTIRFGDSSSDPRTVVGVVAPVKNQLLTEESEPFVYIPLPQRFESYTNIVARAGFDLASASIVRDALLEVDPSLSIPPVTTLDAITGIGVLPQRIAAWVASILGGLAVILCAIGLYGVVAYSVAEQTREFGLRMALGAESRSILTMVVRRGFVLAVPGLAVGAALAFLVGRVLESLLLGLSPTDPIALLGGVGLLLSVITIASVIPARRAAKVDPMEALRYE